MTIQAFPDPQLELALRQLLMQDDKFFERLNIAIAKNPELKQRFDFEGGLNKIIAEIPALPDYWGYIQMYLFYNLSLKQEDDYDIAESTKKILTIALLLQKLLEERVPSNLTIRFDTIDTNLEDLNNGPLKYISNNTALIIAAIVDLKATLTGMLASLTNEVSLVLDKLGDLEILITTRFDDLQTFLIQNFKLVLDKLNELPDKLVDRMIERIEEIDEPISEKVASKIVGESYFRWDANTTYYPTLAFNFKEIGVESYPRRVTIRVRIKENTSELTKEIINSYAERIRGSSDFAFEAGPIRANFVSPDRRYKTTIFVREKETAFFVLKIISYYLDELFNPDFLSITYERKRTKSPKQILNIDDYGKNPQNYQEIFKVSLYRVVLLVNGAEKPLVLLQK